MKKLVIILGIIGLFLFSCKKEELFIPKSTPPVSTKEDLLLRKSTAIVYQYEHPNLGVDFITIHPGFSLMNGGQVGWVDAYFPVLYKKGVIISVQLYKINYVLNIWEPKGNRVLLFTLMPYPAYFPIGTVLTKELWDGVVTGTDFVYEITIDANN
jgi:hypothetical protein